MSGYYRRNYAKSILYNIPLNFNEFRTGYWYHISSILSVQGISDKQLQCVKKRYLK